VSLPTPEPGLVVRFEYLWSEDARGGRETGSKVRPCVIVVASRRTPNGTVEVLVAPITHSAPRDGDVAIELPPEVKAALGLDDARSWMVATELNEFVWPGHDLRADARGRFDLGVLPPRTFSRLRSAILASIRQGRLKRVSR